MMDLFCDRVFSPGDELPTDKGLTISVEDQRMFGYALLPGGKPGEKHPCVILLHGLPGHTTNHDLGQALRRMGFVVLNPFYRGAWGSEGYYSLKGTISDATAAVRWCRTEEATVNYGIDPENIFLLGISMGSWAALHTVCAEPAVKGAAVLAPADIRYLAEARMDFFENAYRKYGCLKLESAESLPREAQQEKDALGLMTLAPKLEGKHVYFLGGTQDTTIPPDAVLRPLWVKLQQLGCTANMRCDFLNTGHSFADCRVELTRRVCSWLEEQLGRSL